VSPAPEPVGLEPVVISAPFGNYIQPRGTTPTLGTFTALRRGGRQAAFGRAMLTVRYYRRLGAWVNRIGLRNPGIDSLVTAPPYGRPVSECLVSIHGFGDAEWHLLLRRVQALRPLGVELNISCPNVGEHTWPDRLFADAVAVGVPVIVKLPPVRYQELAASAFDQGVTWFHATNTLPVPGGGMSGVPLKPLALGVVAWLRDRYGASVGIIGGGGIRSAGDVGDYASAGADRFAVGTYAMRPSALSRSENWLTDIKGAANSAVRAGPRP
jgi:dihydroorotate dehydrogenase